jgi:ParB family chromosome partitioning protein
MTNLKTKAKSPTATGVKILPVADMHVSKLNMRYGKTPPDIDDIYPSILQNGINQSLLVRKEGKGWGVIAGRRRLFALKKKAKETGKPQTAPCIIMESGNVKAAREASLLENVARVPATQLEQFAAYKGLADSGKDVSEIASVFAIPEKSVRRVLALANLSPEILSLFESEKIGNPTVQALTMATPEQQTAWLKLYHGDDYAPQGHNLKEWLTGGARITTDAALFDVSKFDGQIITDLFGETDYFADPDQFWPLQNTAIAEAIAEWKAEGWTDVILLERGTYFDSYEHGKRSLEQGGKIYVTVGHDGNVNPHIGYLPKSDIKKINNILGLETQGKSKSKSSKPEMSGPLQDYVALHRHSAIRATLLGHPKTAMRLTAAHMLVGSDLWNIAPQYTKSRKEATSKSVATSKGAELFEEEREAVYEMLGVSQADNRYSPSKKLAVGDLTELFARLLELDDSAVLRVMTFAMAESLNAGTQIVEAITYAVPVDMTAMWEPDDAFFEILRDKTVINAMVKDIAGKRTADTALTETGKKQKEIIRNRMAGHGVSEAQPDWRPKWMQIPASHYLDKDTCPPAVRGTAASKIMTAARKVKIKKAA